MGTNENKPDMETIADIVREMREAAKSTDLFNGEEVGEPLIRGTKVEEWADRIETAAERERNAHTNDIHNALYMATGIPGNAAAMREALEQAHRTLKLVCEHAGEFVQPRLAEEIIHSGAAVERALSAPARNCDISRDTKETIERCLASLNVESSSASFDAGVCAAIGWILSASAEGGDHA